MLATVIALQLALAQTPANDPRPAPSGVAAQQQAPADDWPYELPPSPPADEPAPSEDPPARRQEGQVSPGTQRTPPRPGALPSLLSAEPLGGGSAALAWAGWSSLGIAYAQGITPRDDLGAALDFDWAKTELRLGAFYRRPLGTAGPFDMAGRLGASWYLNFGGELIYDDNHQDRGLELAPALVLSIRGAGGVFSLSGEVPLTITVKDDAGLLFVPRVAASYEAPLYDELTIGVRAGAGYRAGAGDAPLREGQGELQFVVLVGYRAL